MDLAASWRGISLASQALTPGMNLPPFGVTYDYRCPFARNAHEHILAALAGGAGWEVSFVPFSLSQVHLEEGSTPVWDDPSAAPERLAIEASIVVAEHYPDSFPAAHKAFFAARHDEGRDLRDGEVVKDVLERSGVSSEAVLAEVAASWPRESFRKAHEQAVSAHAVFGVPTFIVEGEAVFVRIMTRPSGDAELAARTIEQVVRLATEHPELNELKHTTIAR